MKNNKRYLNTRSKKIERINNKRKSFVKAKRRKQPFIKLRLRRNREKGRNIVCYAQAIEMLMPKNLKFLLTSPTSPLKTELILAKNIIPDKIISIPTNFSIIENPKESFSVIQNIVKTLIRQEAVSMTMDYINCINTDLLTQIFVDAILKDWNRFTDRLILVQRRDFVKLRRLGGINYPNNLLKMINSVGSPAVLNIRHSSFDDIIPFTLRYYDKEHVEELDIEETDEEQITDLVSYVEKCLKTMNKDLTDQAKQDLGDVIGETLNNASIHSTLSSRYVIGYFECVPHQSSENFEGYLNLVIMNFGQSIYERFKSPLPGVQINEEVVVKMQELSSLYTKKTFFKSNEFHESTLWTLYSLQHGVSIIPDRKRGTGTIKFIDKFLNLNGGEDVNKSRMILFSGDTIIEFDGTYKLVSKYQEDGSKIQIMAFNKEGDLRLKPDKRFVRFSESYFPGTAILAKINLHNNILQNNG